MFDFILCFILLIEWCKFPIINKWDGKEGGYLNKTKKRAKGNIILNLKSAGKLLDCHVHAIYNAPCIGLVWMLRMHGK